MTPFRRREPLHVRLARDGGIPLGEPNGRPAWDASGIHGLHRVREWDAVVTVSAPEVEGERAAFVALPGGDLVLEEGPELLTAFAEALERELDPPYRAEAVRREDSLWAVAGRRIEVVELPGVTGTELELATHGGERTLLVDGERAFGSVPALERPEHVVRARRIDGELWEVDEAAL
ncbi:MAG TPA: hypothetical protein VGH35_11850 [Gaiellaceae bacterium]